MNYQTLLGEGTIDASTIVVDSIEANTVKVNDDIVVHGNTVLEGPVRMPQPGAEAGWVWTLGSAGTIGSAAWKPIVVPQEVWDAIDEVNTAVTEVQENVTNIQTDVTNLTTEVNQHTTDINNLTTEVNNFDNRITNVETTVTNVENNITNLTTEVNQHTTDITNLTTEVSNYVTEVQNFDNRITNVETTVTNVENNITNLTTEVNNIENSITIVEQTIVELDEHKYLGGWSGATNYKKDNQVSHKGALFSAAVDNANSEPTLGDPTLHSFTDSGDLPAATDQIQPQYTTGFTLGLWFRSISNALLQSVKYYKSTSTTETTRDIRIWSNTGSLLYSFQGQDQGTGWNTYPLPVAFALSANVVYVVGVTAKGGYSRSDWGQATETDLIKFGPSPTRYALSGNTFPNSASGHYYFVDVEVGLGSYNTDWNLMISGSVSAEDMDRLHNLAELIETVDNHTTQIGVIENDLDGVQSSVATNTTNITNLQTTVDSHTTQIGVIENEIDALQDDLDDVQSTLTTNTTNITNLQTTVGGHTTSITNLQTTVGNHGTRITALEGQAIPPHNVEAVADTLVMRDGNASIKVNQVHMAQLVNAGNVVFDAPATGVSLNTRIGNQAGNAITSGVHITAVGNRALFNNTTGNNNAGVGLNALFTNTTGSECTAVGNFALQTATAGYANTGHGYQAGNILASGDYNTFVGWKAGSDMTNANQCTMLGALTSNPDNWTNATAVGYGARPTFHNQMRLGNAQLSTVHTDASFHTTQSVFAMDGSVQTKHLHASNYSSFGQNVNVLGTVTANVAVLSQPSIAHAQWDGIYETSADGTYWNSLFWPPTATNQITMPESGVLKVPYAGRYRYDFDLTYVVPSQELSYFMIHVNNSAVTGLRSHEGILTGFAETFHVHGGGYLNLAANDEVTLRVKLRTGAGASSVYVGARWGYPVPVQGPPIHAEGSYFLLERVN